MAALAGCGHPASKEECEEIFQRSADIALKSQKAPVDQAEAERQVADARAAKGQEMVEQCVGKRITDGAMQCIRKASTPDQLDKCVRLW